ncbi:GxxExxY protein [bacterium]|nr:MAG: GxxExxY protein [bacterium]
MKILNRRDIIYPELSYKIVGLLFNVYNEIGYGYQEKYYQRAIAQSLRSNNIQFREQFYMPLLFQGKNIGKFFFDFLIENKMIVEIKKDGHFSKKYIDQVNQYLKISDIKLALLVNFGRDDVKYKRLVNIK